MISKEELMRIAKLYGMRPWQQEKHYVQSLMLAALAEQPVVFKGGTYLWLFHGLARFSEDLDFTLAGEFPEDLAADVSEALRLFGVENSVKGIEGPAGSVAFRLSAKGPLNTGDIDLCHVYVEISVREQVVKKTLPLTFNPAQYSLPSKMLSGMALEEVAAEKARAIMTRDKARDAYDLWFLAKKGLAFDRELADRKLAYYGRTFDKKEFAKALKEKKKAWKPELEQLVFEELPEFHEVERRLLAWVEK